MWLVSPYALFVFVPQNDLLPITVLFVFRVHAAQFQVSGPFSELHVDPAMGMAFAKIVTDRRLIDEMKMAPLIMLPFVRVAVKIGPGMLSFGE